MTRAAALRLASCGLVMAAVACGRQAGADSYASDDLGRKMRVEFDPGSRVRLGALSGVTTQAGERRGVQAMIESGVAYRSERRFGKPGESIRWQFDHRFAWGYAIPGLRSVDGVPALDASLYAMSWLRHADQSYLLLPTERPWKVAFPFDVGAVVEVGRVRTTPAATGPEILRVGVARSAIVLDPWRAAKPGRSLELGMGVRYDLELVGDPGLTPSRTVHRLSPFTSPSARWRWQDQAGRTTTEMAASWNPSWTSERRWDTRSMEVQARIERVVVAVNDEPIALVVDAGYARHGALKGVPDRDELRVTAGLTLGVQLR